MYLLMEAFSNIVFIQSWNNTFVVCVTNLKSIYEAFFFSLNNFFSVYKTGTQYRNVSKESALLLLFYSHSSSPSQKGLLSPFLVFLSRASSMVVTSQRFLERKPPTNYQTTLDLLWVIRKRTPYCLLLRNHFKLTAGSRVH